eukprot:353726_1
MSADCNVHYKAQNPVKSTTLTNNNQPKYHKTHTTDFEPLTSKDIIIIIGTTLLLLILTSIILLLFIYSFDILKQNDRIICALIVITITFIFIFFISALFMKINSNFIKAKHHLLMEREHIQNKQTNAKPHRIRTWSKGHLLGFGSFGKVYKALDRNSYRTFVVKQVELIKDIKGNNIYIENIESIKNEVRTLSKLSHPNVVRYLGSSSTKNHLNIFLEYMADGSIAQMLKEFGPFEVRLIKSYTTQILSGLSFLHSQNIIHRDIKGANILVKDGCLKLADFGFCFSLSLLQPSLPSSMHGTVHWMAPEVFHQNKYDYKADIYSLGITILEMLNGHPPHYNKDGNSVMFLLMNNNDDCIHGGIELPNELGKYGKSLVKECLQRNPNLRPSSKELLQNHSFLCLSDDIEN